MAYDTSNKDRSMRNLQRKAREVAKTCLDSPLPTDDLVTRTREEKPGFFAKLAGKQTKRVEDVASFGWRLAGPERTYNDSRSNPGIEKTENRYYYLSPNGEVIIVSETLLENRLNGYQSGSAFESSTLHPSGFDVLDFRGRKAVVRRWGDGLWQALRKLEQRADLE